MPIPLPSASKFGSFSGLLCFCPVSEAAPVGTKCTAIRPLHLAGQKALLSSSPAMASLCRCQPGPDSLGLVQSTGRFSKQESSRKCQAPMPSPPVQRGPTISCCVLRSSAGLSHGQIQASQSRSHAELLCGYRFNMSSAADSSTLHRASAACKGDILHQFLSCSAGCI